MEFGVQGVDTVAVSQLNSDHPRHRRMISRVRHEHVRARAHNFGLQIDISCRPAPRATARSGIQIGDQGLLEPLEVQKSYRLEVSSRR